MTQSQPRTLPAGEGLGFRILGLRAGETNAASSCRMVETRIQLLNSDPNSMTKSELHSRYDGEGLCIFHRKRYGERDKERVAVTLWMRSAVQIVTRFADPSEGTTLNVELKG